MQPFYGNLGVRDVFCSKLCNVFLCTDFYDWNLYCFGASLQTTEPTAILASTEKLEPTLAVTQTPDVANTST
ncbi:MAG: hypothetical protein NWF00_10670 [Candidatus Bathyarchaeota archaeon]|nr:hypothetical protein [Candidatus Bathyarchaeota archaeon]